MGEEEKISSILLTGVFIFLVGLLFGIMLMYKYKQDDYEKQIVLQNEIDLLTQILIPEEN